MEYKFNRSFGVNVQLPYTWIEKTKKGKTTDYNNLDNLELSLKFANFTFEDQGWVIGYGLGVGIPTGDDDKTIGSDHIWQAMPFLNAGKAFGDLEVIGHVNLVLNGNENDSSVEDAVEYDLSLLYHVNKSFAALVEFNGDSLLDDDDHTVINISPGIKLIGDKQANPHWEFALGASFPLTNEEHFDHELTAQFSLFF